MRRTVLQAMAMQMLLRQLYSIMPHTESFRGGKCFVGVAEDGVISLYLPLRTSEGEYSIKWSKGDLEMDTEALRVDGASIACRVFRLFDKAKAESYFDLMTGLVALLEDDQVPMSEMNAVITRALVKWYGLFAEQSAVSLLGLYGELVILEVLASFSSASSALKCWHGPWRSLPQDFASLDGKLRLEAKAKLDRTDKVTISSGFQLDVGQDQRLVLAVVRGEIRAVPSGAQAMSSLPQLVARLCSAGGGFSEHPRFAEGCRREGYIVDGPSNSLLRKDILLERIDFYDAKLLPRLVPGTIPASPSGIDPATVQYEIDLSSHNALYSIDLRTVGLSSLRESPIGGFLAELAGA